MYLARNLNPPLRTLYVILGLAFLAYGIWVHGLIAGLNDALLILIGALFLAAGVRGT